MRHAALDRQAGVSLAELLIALTLLLVVATGALTTYDNTVDAFKRGGIAAEQQQGVRIAFEKIGEDVQMAGFNYNPDADPDRSDEQIEAAYDTAIVIRADFDGHDPVLSLVPETALAGGVFDVVSTGNDEIVAYVLAKPDWSGGSQLKFRADTDDPERDGSTETVKLYNVAMVQDDPPYTLYRVTLSNDLSTWDTFEFFDRTVLAENIGWLRFRYFDAAGDQLNSTFDLDSTSDDIGGSNGGRPLRAKIRRVQIDLLGLALDTDPSWVDWSDPDPITRHYRKFRLTGDFRLRNAGLTGIEDTGGTGFGNL